MSPVSTVNVGVTDSVTCLLCSVLVPVVCTGFVALPSVKSVTDLSSVTPSPSSRTPVPLMDTPPVDVAEPSALTELAASVPALMVCRPVCVLVPLRTHRPASTLVMPRMALFVPTSEMTPDSVLLPVFVPPSVRFIRADAVAAVFRRCTVPVSTIGPAPDEDTL